MYLLLDIGNTRDKAAVISDGGITVVSELNGDSLLPYQIEAVYYANVSVQERVNTLKRLLGMENIPWRQIVTEKHAFGVVNSYQQHQLLGVDRWLALLGAQRLYPQQNVLVIDAGTAVTVDWLSCDGTHQGGWILPGLKLMQQAVVSNTAKVFTAATMKGKLTPGTDTVACLHNGCLAAVTGAITQAASLYNWERIVITGGDGAYLANHLETLPVIVEPHLLFHGLARYIDN